MTVLDQLPPEERRRVAAALEWAAAEYRARHGALAHPTLLIVARELRLEADGFRAETERRSWPASFISVDGAASALGISVQAVRKRCRLHRIPGAVLIAGRWLIPAEYLEEQTHVAEGR